MLPVIVAPCTPPGRGALALIRVSGQNAVALVDTCSKLFSSKTLQSAASHTIHFGQIMDSDRVLDQVLFLLMRAPKTFTGEDTVEITCHGNPIIVEQILQLLIAKGAKLAQPGEFSQRAFLNGKLDLVQAEAIHELVMSNTQLALDQSMRKLKAGLSCEIAGLENLVLDLIAALEVSFEFLEEEERDFGFNELIASKFAALEAKSRILKQSCQEQSKIGQGIKIAILGVPNAGKSTLFNAILGHNRAIVSSEAGTTRDSIESLVAKEGQIWSLVDTAGIRETCNLIEQEGIARAMQEAALSDLIIFVYDPLGEKNLQLELLTKLQQNFAAKILFVYAKEDLVKFCAENFKLSIQPDVILSAKTGIGVNALQKKIAQKIQTLFAKQGSLFALNARQKLLLEQFFQTLNSIQAQFTAQVANEILSIELRAALQNLSDLTGRDSQEMVLEQVFANFCVGK